MEWTWYRQGWCYKDKISKINKEVFLLLDSVA